MSASDCSGAFSHQKLSVLLLQHVKIDYLSSHCRSWSCLVSGAPVAVLSKSPASFHWIGVCFVGKWQLIRTKVFCANVFVLLNLTPDKVWNCWARRQSRSVPLSVSPLHHPGEYLVSRPLTCTVESYFQVFFLEWCKIFHLVLQPMGDGAEKSPWGMGALTWFLRHSSRIKQSPYFFLGGKKKPTPEVFNFIPLQNKANVDTYPFYKR